MPQKAENNHALEDFRNIYNDLDSVYAAFPKACGLSAAEYWALVMVYEGAATQRDICEQLSLSRQTVNSAFGQLVKKGLVCLQPLENNLRTKRVTLTKAGAAFVAKYIGAMHALEESTWQAMEPAEQLELVRLLRKYKNLMHTAVQPLPKQNSHSSEDVQS